MRDSKPTRHPKPPRRLPKLCGADVELGNFILGRDQPADTYHDAARALLREIEGQANPDAALPVNASSVETPSGNAGHRAGGHIYPANDDRDPFGAYDYGQRCGSGAYVCRTTGGGYGAYTYDPQDWGRKYLRSNGGCAYIDLGHFELCQPEVLSAFDHVACGHAMLRIARQAQIAATDRLPDGQRVQVLASNSDGLGNSYGSHLDFLITRRAWVNLFRRKLHLLLNLASYQASSIVFAGQGKVGGENGRPWTPYQIAIRPDFIETLVGEQTTYRRPIVNARDEGLCGEHNAEMARLHVIFYDNNLAHVAALLKVGVMQIVLAMIEAERVDCSLILDDPVLAVAMWSRDPLLQARAKTTEGQRLTAVELQLRFCEAADRFVHAGGCDGIVPRARDILSLWADTLGKLEAAATANDLAALAPLAPRLDWVMKLFIIDRVMRQHPGLDWRSSETKHLDHLYSSVDPNEGLYWAYERSGAMQRVVTDGEIERFVHQPPGDTRAWTRAMLLRAAGPDAVDQVDWDSIRLKFKGGRYWATYRTFEMGDPLAFTKADAQAAFDAADLGAVLDALDCPSATDPDHAGEREDDNAPGTASAVSEPAAGEDAVDASEPTEAHVPSDDRTHQQGEPS